jgi:hypothetical protein
MKHSCSCSGFLKPFIYKNDHFTKTGSGQTQGNHSKKACKTGIKSDLRLYVFVTGIRPLRIYLHDGGLVRFAIEPYEEEEAPEPEPEPELGAAGRPQQQCGDSGPAGPQRRRQRRPEAHLTNSSLHADSEAYERNTGVAADGVGSKWSLDAFWRHIEEIPSTKPGSVEADAARSGDSKGKVGKAGVAALRDAIGELVVRTVLAAEPALRGANEQLETQMGAEQQEGDDAGTPRYGSEKYERIARGSDLNLLILPRHAKDDHGN